MNKNSSQNVTNVIYLVAFFFILVWVNKLFKSIMVFFGAENSDAEKKSQKDELDLVDKEIKYEYLSHPKSQYYAMVDAIEVALQAGWTEDEMAVYGVFRKLWNNSDFLMLKKAWKTRPIGVIGFRTTMTLEKAIRYYFNEKEINTANYVLASQKGGYITYRI